MQNESSAALTRGDNDMPQTQNEATGGGNKRRRVDNPPASPTTPIQPRQNDVLMGRGRPYQNSTGNKRMLRIVSKYKNEYTAKPREQKRAFVEIVLDEVLKGGTLFLKRKDNEPTKAGESPWEKVDRPTAAEKVWHALRDKKDHGKEKGSERLTIPDNAEARGWNTSTGADQSTETAAALLQNSQHRIIEGVASTTHNNGVAATHPSSIWDEASRLFVGQQRIERQQMPTSEMPAWYESRRNAELAKSSTSTLASAPLGSIHAGSQQTLEQSHFLPGMERAGPGTSLRIPAASAQFPPRQEGNENQSVLESKMRDIMNQASVIPAPIQPVQSPSASSTPSANQGDKAGMLVAIQIFDSALRSLIEELSRASHALQVAAAVASIPQPPSQGQSSATRPAASHVPAVSVEQNDAIANIKESLRQFLSQQCPPVQAQHFASTGPASAHLGSAPDSSNNNGNENGNNADLTWSILMSLYAMGRSPHASGGNSAGGASSSGDHSSRQGES